MYRFDLTLDGSMCRVTYMSTTATRKEVRRLALEAIANSRRIHQQWHWDTHQTACPWGCGDGSRIQTK